jgi:PAS domain S-box-containing protein
MASMAQQDVPVNSSGSGDVAATAGATAAGARVLQPDVHDFRAIFDASNDAILIHDIETGAIVDANRVACEVHGVTVDELRVRGIDLIGNGPPPFTAELAATYIARATAGDPQRFEWCSFHPASGVEMWAEVSLQRVAMGTGDRLLAIVRDIRERKHAEQALRQANEALERRVAERTAELEAANRALEAEIAERAAAERLIKAREEHFRALIENAHDITTIIDAEGRIKYTTPAFRRVLGYDPTEVIGRTVFEFYHPEDAERDRPVLEEVVAKPGTVGRSQHRLRHRDGSYRVLDAFARTLAPDSADQGIVANVRDVTEAVHAEAALRRSEEHFRRLIENGSDFIMIVDTTGAITYAGPTVTRILGYEPHEMIGSRPVALVHPEDVPHVMDVLADVVAHPGKAVTTTFRIRHRDGSWRVFENIGKTLSPHTADDGVVANGRDVTERHRTEAALAQAKEAAERANRAKSDFLSRMSHELRTPMNSILGFAQVLEGLDLPDRQRKCVDHILRAGRHLLQLINEVLEISRIEAGRHVLSLEPVRIDAVLHDAISLARPMAAQAGVDIEYAAPESADIHVRADRQRVSQVLLNLLSNAIKYNRAGGRVRVHCERSSGSDDEEAVLVVRVEDTGRGIAPEMRSDLFTPFARLGAENSGVEGTGLGLALSHRLTEVMGGNLTLERSSSDGSVFRLELRTTPSPLQRIKEPSAPRVLDDVPHRTATLLHVEDNLANMSLVETVLWVRPRWRTIPALQGQIGVELARQHLPDVVLLDLHLPDIRGEEVLRRLKEDGRTAAIPVVIISADATKTATERLLAAGAAAFLTKPLDVAEFLATLDLLLPV